MDTNTAIYNGINSGWNAVKIVDVTIIPYCWFILPRSFLWDTLLVGYLLDLLHIAVVFALRSIPYYFPSQPAINLWLVQCLCCAFVRIVEIVYNGKIVSILQEGKLYIWQWVWFTICAAAIVAGRLCDTLYSPVAEVSAVQIRIGMAGVSLSGVLVSLPVIRPLVIELRRAMKFESEQGNQGIFTSVCVVLRQASTRLIFLNLIDFGLFFYFLFPASTVAPYFRFWFDNWDNSRLSYYALDALLSKLLKEDSIGATKKKTESASMSSHSYSVSAKYDSRLNHA